MKLVFATYNKNKAFEIDHQIGGGIVITTLSELGWKEDIPETAETLEGNALLKARHVYEKTGLPCFADDSGLEVKALNGEPGVRSARYAGELKSDEANIKKLLSVMQGVSDRSARFRTVIALILEDGQEVLFEGIVDGEITNEPAGNKGFGYDPIFRRAGESRTFAEMTVEEKNAVSHRSRAVNKLVEYLRSKRSAL